MSLHGYSDDDGFELDYNVTLISKLDVSDPMHLHPNDSATLTVISVKLKGSGNYQVWSCTMLLALEHKNKISFIDGTCRRLKALWKQFDALIELPGCICHAGNDFKKHNQLMKLMQFLMGLDDTYMQIKSSILSKETLPDVRSVYAIISLIKDNKISEKGVHANMAWGNQHMTYTDKNLVNVIDVSHLKIKVSHPNGTEAFITKIENMPLTNYLNLYDVLVVPEYRVSLMSVHKVTRDSKLIVAFNEMNYYVLNHDLRIGKVLGTGKQIGRLYYFNRNKGQNKLDKLFLLVIMCQLNWVNLFILICGDLIRLPTYVLNGNSPYGLVYNKPPSLKHLRSFGCLAYATILNSHDKFGSRFEKCVLVGYSNFKKGYKLWSLDNRQ
ncbi:ribonuclease H-like domain-containing protein, partial [Tanacetum coccineum]